MTQNLILYLFAAFVAGMAVMDFILTIVPDDANAKFNAQKAAPYRFIVYGAVLAMIADTFVLLYHDVTLAILIGVGIMLFSAGLIWLRASRRQANP